MDYQLEHCIDVTFPKLHNCIMIFKNIYTKNIVRNKKGKDTVPKQICQNVKN